ncbi:MAG TPA: amidohydrolase family protein [Jiangellales bacterium]|nr:amidohydrolase family protein [Jiangellales bacterium]
MHSEDGPVYDVHAHYLPREALDHMGVGRAVVRLAPWCGVDEHITLNGMPVGSTIEQLSSVDSMLETMARTGIDIRVVSPPPFTYRYWSDPQDSLRLCQLLNDSTAALVAEHPTKFVGLCTVPLQDPDLALAEFTRARDQLGLTGVTLGTNVDGRNLSDPALRAFLAAVVERDAPVLVHPDFVPNDRLARHYLLNLVGMPTETATTLANLILSGALAALPDLRICFVHGGGSTPYLFGRLNKGWQVRPETREFTPDPPDRYLTNVFFDSLTHSPQALRYLVDVVGADHVVIGTDSPFDVEDTAPLRHLARVVGLTAAETEAITRTTALRWLHGDRAPSTPEKESV